MAIRWTEFPHADIFTDIYSRLNENGVERSADDSLQHILRRRLHFLVNTEHRRFVELESRRIVAHLRCTRDAYRAFTDKQRCSPATEAYWVVLRFAVLPTAIARLKESVADYGKLTRIKAADLSILFGIHTQAFHFPNFDGTPGKWDCEDRTPATDAEIRKLSAMVNEDTLLWLEDRRYGHPIGGGPFAADDAFSIRRSWGLCASIDRMTLIEWMPIRERLWREHVPWTEGLATLFGCVQEELLSQCRAIYPDGIVQERQRDRQSPEFESVTVPEPMNEFVKDGGVWTLTFMARTTRVPANTIGFDYISAILRSEGRPMGALELQSAAGGNPSRPKAVENALDSLRQQNEKGESAEGDFSLSLSGQDFGREPVLDDVGRERLQAALLDLEKQTTAALEIGDTKKAEKLQNDYERVERELELSRNIHRRSRVFSSENEKARVSITQALSRAYRKIEKHSPELVGHLRTAIATGSEFWYRDTSIKWKC